MDKMKERITVMEEEGIVHMLSFVHASTTRFHHHFNFHSNHVTSRGFNINNKRAYSNINSSSINTIKPISISIERRQTTASSRISFSSSSNYFSYQPKQQQRSFISSVNWNTRSDFNFSYQRLSYNSQHCFKSTRTRTMSMSDVQHQVFPQLMASLSDIFHSSTFNVTSFITELSTSPSFQSDCKLTGIILLLVIFWLVLWQQLTTRNIVSSLVTRKVIHITCGPAFISLWPFYSDLPTSRILASIIPVLFIIALIESGTSSSSSSSAITNTRTNISSLGKSISRSGDNRDALGGPLYYTFILLTLTLFQFKQFIAVITISQLCIGDAMAEIIGRKFGHSSPWPMTWAKSKSIIGTSAFAISAFFASFAALFWFDLQGLPHPDLMNSWTVFGIGTTSIACALVELAPASIVFDDNVAIAVMAVFISTVFFNGRMV